MAVPNETLTKQERLDRARNKIRLMRRSISKSKREELKLRDLVREYVAQRPDATLKILKKWIDNNRL